MNPKHIEIDGYTVTCEHVTFLLHPGEEYKIAIVSEDGDLMHFEFVATEFEAGIKAARWLDANRRERELDTLIAEQAAVLKRFSDAIIANNRQYDRLLATLHSDMTRAQFADLWAVVQRIEGIPYLLVIGVAYGEQNAIVLAEELAEQFWPRAWEWNGGPGEQLVLKGSRASSLVPMTIRPLHRVCRVRLDAHED